MTKKEALRQLNLCAMALAMAQPTYTGFDLDRFRRANAAVAWAALAAAWSGASCSEIDHAAHWQGMAV